MKTLKTLMLSIVAITLVASAAEPAHADEHANLDAAAEPWTFAVAPRAGLTVPTSELGAMAVGGLALDYATPLLGGRLVFALDGSITRPGSAGAVSDPRIGGPGDWDLDVTQFKLGLNAIYRLFGPERALIPYAGAGPVLHMLRTSQTTSTAPGANTARNTELGFELLGGADFRAGPGYVLGEVRIIYSNLDHLFTGNTNAGNVMLSAGYRLVF